MPKVFNVIDATMKARMGETALSGFVSGAPNARVHSNDGRVLSQVYQSRNGGPGIRIRGVYDTLFELNSGGYAIVDLKTISVSPKLARTYASQLNAYAWALENPSAEANRLAPIGRMALIAFEPTRFTSRPDSASALVGRNVWIEVERDDQSFFAFLDQIVEVLASETPPAPGKYCSTCKYLERIGKFEMDSARFKMAV